MCFSVHITFQYKWASSFIQRRHLCTHPLACSKLFPPVTSTGSIHLGMENTVSIYLDIAVMQFQLVKLPILKGDIVLTRHGGPHIPASLLYTQVKILCLCVEYFFSCDTFICLSWSTPHWFINWPFSCFLEELLFLSPLSFGCICLMV